MKLAIKERLAASGAASKLLSKLPGRGDKKPGKKRRWKKFAVAGVALVVAAGVGWQMLSPGQSSAASATSYTTAEVTRMDVSSSITGSGTLEAADSYSVTTLIEGSILTADFEDVQRVDVTLDGATETFTAEDKGDGRTWTWDGEEVEFSALQIAIEDLTADSFTSETPSQRQEVALTVYLDHETFPQVEIALYRYDGSHCLAVVDGTPACLVSRADAVNLMETVRSIVLGGEESGG